MAQQFAPLDGPEAFGSASNNKPPPGQKNKSTFEVEDEDNFDNPLKTTTVELEDDADQYRNSEVSAMEAEQAALTDKNGNLIYENVSLDWCLVVRMDRENPDDLPADTRELCARLFEAGLYVKHHIGVKRNEMYLQVGATDEMLMHEATHYMEIPMAVKGPRPMKGTIMFHEELTKHFTSKVGAAFVFNSGQRQRIVMSIMKRKATIDPYLKALAPRREVLLKKAQKKSTKSKGDEEGRGLQRWAMKELLEANGCSMSELSRERMLATLPVCMNYYMELLKIEEDEVQKQGSSNPGARIDVESQAKVIAELEKKGVRSFQGEMITVFPLHDDKELETLSERWANWSLMWKWNVEAEATADGEASIGGTWRLLRLP